MCLWIKTRHTHTYTHTSLWGYWKDCVLSFLQKKHLKRPFRTKGGFLPLHLELMLFPSWVLKSSSQFLIPSTLQCSGSTRLKVLWVIPVTCSQAATPAPKAHPGREKAEGWSQERVGQDPQWNKEYLSWSWWNTLSQSFWSLICGRTLQDRREGWLSVVSAPFSVTEHRTKAGSNTHVVWEDSFLALYGANELLNNRISFWKVILRDPPNFLMCVSFDPAVLLIGLSPTEIPAQMVGFSYSTVHTIHHQK